MSNKWVGRQRLDSEGSKHRRSSQLQDAPNAQRGALRLRPTTWRLPSRLGGRRPHGVLAAEHARWIFTISGRRWVGICRRPPVSDRHFADEQLSSYHRRDHKPMLGVPNRSMGSARDPCLHPGGTDPLAISNPNRRFGSEFQGDSRSARAFEQLLVTPTRIAGCCLRATVAGESRRRINGRVMKRQRTFRRLVWGRFDENSGGSDASQPRLVLDRRLQLEPVRCAAKNPKLPSMAHGGGWVSFAQCMDRRKR